MEGIDERYLNVARQIRGRLSERYWTEVVDVSRTMTTDNVVRPYSSIHTFTSRDAWRPSLCIDHSPKEGVGLPQEGSGECRAFNAPAASHAK